MCASCYQAYKVKDADFGQRVPKEVVQEFLEILKDKIIFWTKVIFTFYSLSLMKVVATLSERCIKEMRANLEN